MQQADPGNQDAAGPSGTLEMDAELVDDIEALVESGQRPMVMNILADLHPADTAQLLVHLSRQNAERVFEWLPSELAGDVVVELDDDYRAGLLEDVAHTRLTAVIDELDTDDAADVLSDLPDEVAEAVLPTLEDADHVETLLGYDEETAGGLMAAELVAVPPGWTVAQATEEVRRNAETVEEVFVIFVVDDAYRLRGFVSLRRLLLAPADARIETVMNSEPVMVTTSVDQEEVARVMERYDLVSLAVVNEAGRLVGRITIDDVVDVIREEAEEDIQRMSGVAGGEETTDSVFRVVRGRLPWLLAGLAGAGMAAGVIHRFEEALQASALLASFIPIVMATAGNAGIQSSAIAVQGLAAGDIWSSDLLSRIAKEVAVSILNGLAAAAILGTSIVVLDAFLPGLIMDAGRLAYTAGLSLVIVIMLATTIGATIPLLLEKVGIDPALATGPFITATNDILGTLVFFSLAEALYL
jgi:magnesium transporter